MNSTKPEPWNTRATPESTTIKLEGISKFVVDELDKMGYKLVPKTDNNLVNHNGLNYQYCDNNHRPILHREKICPACEAWLLAECAEEDSKRVNGDKPNTSLNL